MRYDNHRHYGGCISPSFVHKYLNNYDIDTIKKSMICNDNEDRTFLNFLEKFKILKEIKWDRDILRDSISQVHWDIVKDKLDYTEIHFSVDKYYQHGWDIKDTILFMFNHFDYLDSLWGNKTSLILSLRYESDKDFQLEVAQTIEDEEIRSCIKGIDLVGNEKYLDKDFHADIIKLWKNYGKGTIAHVGESHDIKNVEYAINIFNVDRIAHGIKIIEDVDLMKESIKKNICFDVALTSNICTGVVDKIEDHPIVKMLDFGCIVTIGTDDPVQYNTNLDKEYNILKDTFGYSNDDIINIMNNSLKYSFDQK